MTQEQKDRKKIVGVISDPLEEAGACMDASIPCYPEGLIHSVGEYSNYGAVRSDEDRVDPADPNWREKVLDLGPI